VAVVIKHCFCYKRHHGLSMLSLSTADNGTSAPENGASGCCK
jgi:hypothetical protein